MSKLNISKWAGNMPAEVDTSTFDTSSIDIKLKGTEKKWMEIMGKFEPSKYGSGYATTATESRHVDSLYSSREGRLQVGTSDGSTITININKDSIEFDGIEITTEMLRNVTKKIKEQDYKETPF